MTAVTRVLPRYWDGQRLLRFLTGLAMLALAFTVHVAPPAPARPAAAPALPADAPAVAAPAVVAPAVAAPAAAASGAAVAEVASDSAATPHVEAPIVSPPAVPAEPAPRVLAFAALLLLVAGYTLRVRAERAPPLA